jgi:hypothetical protein
MVLIARDSSVLSAETSMTTYEAWQDLDDNSILLATPEAVTDQRAKRLLGPNAELFYRLEAATREEAEAIHALRMGWTPYRPVGRPAPCARFGATYYPDGSAECRRCGLALSR